MFDKFGEFNSAEEINRAAAGLLAEGDTESIFTLAEENGIDREDAQDYIDGTVPDLATVFSAAIGRLVVLQKEEVSKKGRDEKTALTVILNMLRSMCAESGIASAVMQKDKRISKIYGAMKEAARNNKSGNMGVCCGTDRELISIISAYILNGEGEMKDIITTLYQQ